MSRSLERTLAVTVLGLSLTIVVLRFLAIDAASHSVSDTLRPWFVESGAVMAVAIGVVILLRRVAAARRE